jgi:copper homeostasis protein
VTLLEICVDDVEGALAAEAGGADRIELCSGLSEGGITPSLGLVRQVLAGVQRIAVNVIVRPRGGDFVYAPAELDAVLADLEELGRHRVGAVVGALTPDGEIDRAALRRIREACPGASLTFHKAFDATADLGRSLETLIDFGVDRVLTSGGRATALEGADVLAGLVRQAAGRIVVMAGGGVRPANVRTVLARSGVYEVHLRAAEKAPSASRFVNPELPYDDGSRSTTSEATIRAMVSALA